MRVSKSNTMSLDVILRHEIVEQARAGDTVIFTGTVVVIPDIMALVSPGERSECRRDASQRKGSTGGNDGIDFVTDVVLNDFIQICDGRREIDIKNRKKDVDDDDDDQLITSGVGELSKAIKKARKLSSFELLGPKNPIPGINEVPPTKIVPPTNSKKRGQPTKVAQQRVEVGSSSRQLNMLGQNLQLAKVCKLL
ncbi:hypothetical protein ACSQ67_008638 [Phaseolus vulgaris]